MIPLEIDEQKMYTNWLDSHKIVYFAVPNVVTLAPTMKKVQHRIRFWQKRKKEGVKKGVPDLVVFLPKQILFVEMKRLKKSSTSKEQKEWNTTINIFPYSIAVICKGGQAAIDTTRDLLVEK